jgi:hypothetical protein
VCSRVDADDKDAKTIRGLGNRFLVDDERPAGHHGYAGKANGSNVRDGLNADNRQIGPSVLDRLRRFDEHASPL